MAKVILSDLANLQNQTTAVNTINVNNDAVATAMENTLSRDGTSPNQMNANLDMNSNRILNLPDASSDQEPVTKGVFDDTIESLESSVPLFATFVTVTSNGILENERRLTAGTNISISDAGAGNTITVGISGEDLNAYEALTGTGLVSRTTDGAAATRTITAPAAGITVTNGDGVSGNPTLALANDLAAIEGLSTTGAVVRTGDGTATTRTITGTANEITVTNGDGVSGNPTLSIPSAVTLTGKTVTGGTLSNPTITVADNALTVQDNSDATKQLQFQLSGITTGNTRTLTAPDASTTIAGTDATQTLTNKTISGSSNTLSNVALSSLATQAAYTFVGNNTGSAAAPTAVDVAGLTTKASPDSGDYLMISDQAASGAWKKATLSSVATVGSVTSVNGEIGAVVVGSPACGRLTLTSGVPVLTSTVSGATTVYYTPYNGRTILIYDGTDYVPTVFTELSQATTDNTKSPAACTTDSNYDIFVWNDSGTIRATRGPAWSSSTSRGTGAGTTELTRSGGLLLNANSITNGPAASRGTYVGTIRTNGSSQVDWIYGAVATNWTAGFFGVWNMYNRVLVSSFNGDDATSWTYASATPRAPNGNSTARFSFISGIEEDVFRADYSTAATSAAGNGAGVGIGYDSTSAKSGRANPVFSGGTYGRCNGEFATTSLGFHYFSALEFAFSTNSVTFWGDGNVPLLEQGGMYFTGRM